ncbi:MAG: IS1380 family transposase [Atopostipes sp.]|nr:IS1380 family transposase [Atopostipes sp.]
MTNLQEKRANFNQKFIVTNNGGEVSVDGGLVLIKEFLHQTNFQKLVKKFIPFRQKRSNSEHSLEEILELVLYQIYAGYEKDDSHDDLKSDPAFQNLLEKENSASQPTVSRFWPELTEDVLSGIEKLIDYLNDGARFSRKQEELVIDIDSTHFDTFGQQEKTDYNAHYGTYGYHPLVAFDGVHGDFLKAELRPGNVYTSTGADTFLQELLSSVQKDSLLLNSIVLRADSGFASPEIYEICEEQMTDYLIRLKSNARLKKLAKIEMDGLQNDDYTENDSHYFDLDYKAASWSRSRRVSVLAERPAGELFYRYTFVVNTFSQDIPTEDIIRAYKRRGVMENDIKEAKNGFFMGKTDSTKFQTNRARMVVSQLAYTLIQLLKSNCLPKEDSTSTMATLRHRFLKVAVKVAKHARKTYFNLSTSHVYGKEFFTLLENIQNFQLKVP